MKITGTALAVLLGLGLALPAAAQAQQQGTQNQQQQGQQGQQGQEMTADATIATVDQTSLLLTTEEGDEYTLAEGNLVQGLQSGQKVRITFTEQDGTKTVTNIEPAMQ